MEVSSLLSEEPSQKPKSSAPKTVAFELLLDEGSKTRARIPLRILVNPHDTTDSIITTVKNFYGIYDGHGVSFEDVNGNILIASYENLVHNTVVYVRTVAGSVQPPAPLTHTHYQYASASELHRKPSLGEPFQMLPPHVYDQSHSPSRPASRLARKRSISPPHIRGRRSASQQKPGSHAGVSRGSSANGSYHDDVSNTYSDSEAGRSSIAGSKKARSEQFASAEISLENVLQDGRRKKILFESSELPLFVPPQVPVATSTSSISPQRRSLPQDGPSPFHPPAPKLYTGQPQPLLSPQSHGNNSHTGAPTGQYNASNNGTPVPQHGHRLRDRSMMQPSQQNMNGRSGYFGPGILPTPDPTVASCISDEDVARQLIALGDASNFSYGRTSNSTLDDTFSGAADATSSTGATSDSDEYSEAETGLPSHRRFSDEEDGEFEEDTVIKSEFDEFEGAPKTKKIKTKIYDGPSNANRISKVAPTTKAVKSGRVRTSAPPKASKPATQVGFVKVAAAPMTTGQQRKTSSSSTLNFQNQLGVDEEDLSSKPRCQRCRKSKKGCDRQRPCQRCKDAGIGIDGCVSEDEVNGRKGRYGRHMGVPVKRSAESMVADEDFYGVGATLSGLSTAQNSPEKSKKRKR